MQQVIVKKVVDKVVKSHDANTLPISRQGIKVPSCTTHPRIFVVVVVVIMGISISISISISIISTVVVSIIIID